MESIRRKCVAQNCCNSDCDKITFHRFPKDKERAIIWAQAAMRHDLIANAEKLYKSHRLCAAHFEKKYYLNDVKKILLASAVPTVFQIALPLNQNLIQENIENDPLNTLALNDNEDQTALPLNQNLAQENIGNDLLNTLALNDSEGNKDQVQILNDNEDQSTQTSQMELEEICHIEEGNRGANFTTTGVQTSSYLIHRHKIVEDLKHKNKKLQNCTNYLEHKIKNLEERVKTRELSFDEWSKHCETFLSPECATFVQNQAFFYKKRKRF